jgi:hypothetical protein
MTLPQRVPGTSGINQSPARRQTERAATSKEAWDALSRFFADAQRARHALASRPHQSVPCTR